MNTKNDLALIKSEIATYERKEGLKECFLASAGLICLLAALLAIGIVQ